MIEPTAFYQIKFHYKDGKEVNINVSPIKLSAFLESLHQSKVFWSQEEDENQSADNGFWTNMEDIRFLQIQAVKGETLDESERKDETLPVTDDLCGEKEKTSPSMA